MSDYHPNPLRALLRRPIAVVAVLGAILPLTAGAPTPAACEHVRPSDAIHAPAAHAERAAHPTPTDRSPHADCPQCEAGDCGAVMTCPQLDVPATHAGRAPAPIGLDTPTAAASEGRCMSTCTHAPLTPPPRPGTSLRS